MKNIDTPIVHASVIADDIVLAEAHEGVNIDAEKSRHANQLIADAMPGNYGMIIDRKKDYSIIPVEVYEVLNSLDRLKAIAVVTHRKISSVFASVEKPMFHGHFKIFADVESARVWIEEVLQN